MYGNITIPGGIGGTADKETQNKLKKALKGVTAEMDITGNAGTADKLKTARKIGNVSFDGSADITLDQIGAAAAGHTHTAQTSVTGNAGTATKLAAARKITLTGAVSGNVDFDGSKDVTLTTTDNNLPAVGSISLRANNWTEQNGAYRQNVTISGLTANHQVDLYADYATEEELPSAICPVNNAGTFYVVTGEPPETDITVQYTMFLTQKA